MRAFIFCLISFMSLSAHAASIVVLQGGESEFDRKYFSGFSSLATEPISAFNYEPKKEKALLNKLKVLSPDLIFAIGNAPLPQLAALLPSTPILANDPYAQAVASKANVVVLKREDTLHRILDLARTVFPNRKNIGTIFNPKLSQARFDLLTKEAAKHGAKVAALKVDTATDVQAFIGQFTGKIDLLYWIEDATTNTDLALMEVYAFAEQASVPVFSLSPGHIHRGAFMTVSIDPFKMGEQAWKTADLILREGKIPQMAIQTEAGHYTVSLSMKAIGKFGLGAEKLFGFLQKATKEGYTVQIK